MKIFLSKWISLLAASTLLVAAAGCGGSGGSNTDDAASKTITTSSRSRAEFVKLANGICKSRRIHLLDEMGVYLKEHESGAKPGEAAIDAFRVVGLPKISEQIEEIRSLGAPEGDQQQVEAFLVALQQVVDAPPQSMVRHLRHSAKLARSYGLADCSYA